MMYFFIGSAICIIIFLCVKIRMMHKAADEISEQLGEILNGDTNLGIRISSADRHMRLIASEMNKKLEKIREKECRLETGNSELLNSISAVSHDLRTPLTAMCGYIDLLEHEEKSKTAEKYTAMIKNRAEALKLLMEELFQYSVICLGERQEEYEDVCLNALLEECLAANYAALKISGIVPEIDIPENKVIRHLNKNSTARIFSNVISNAIKYSGGDFFVSLSEQAEVVFKNSAPNLDVVTAGKLFDRFYTVENARGSTGLGLSIAKTLVSEMGGVIEAHYEDGMLCIVIRFT